MIAITNARSIQPKIYSIIEDIELHDIDILGVTEVWEKPNQPLIEQSLEYIAQMKGFY